MIKDILLGLCFGIGVILFGLLFVLVLFYLGFSADTMAIIFVIVVFGTINFIKDKLE